MNPHSNVTSYIKSDKQRGRYGYWVIRENQDTKNLTDCDRQFVLAAVQRHNDRIDRGDWRPRTGGKDYLAILTEEVAVAVRPLIGRLYRTSISGDLYITVRLAVPGAEGYTTKNWSVYGRNPKWAGRDAHIRVNVMHGWRRHVAGIPGLADADGMLTTHARQVAENAWEASWVVQSTGVSLNVANGFIATDGEDWAHAKTLVAARKLLKQRKVEVKIAELAKDIAGMSKADLVAQFGAVEVTAADSRKAGNCAAGTSNFVNRYFLGRKSATVAELCASEIRVAWYAIARAIGVAVARSQV